MNINRLLSRRDKDGSGHRRDKSRDKSREKSGEKDKDRKARPSSSDGIMALFNAGPPKKLDKERSHKISTIKHRLHDRGSTDMDDGPINYALSSQYANGDVDKAFEMVILYQESLEGVIKPYDLSVQMQGADNRNNVTCYLDSILFAMFARLDSFEPILRTTFDDEPRRRLSTLLRLWVNMLRTGKPIHTDITSQIQDALSSCGWEGAARLEQQDTSEAFTFITEKLELPLLTLKMDIYHTGKEDEKDDHKFVHERLLEVAIPDEPPEGFSRPIRLEDCLESFLNNRVEVVRRLERSNTLTSARSGAISPSTEKEDVQHVEVKELPWSGLPTPNTPTTDHSLIAPLTYTWENTPAPGSDQAPSTPLTPNGSRIRAPSIIRHRLVEEEATGDSSDSKGTPSSIRKQSVKKEVLMPAWQFFNLIPWYTKTSPTNDAEVAAHFSKTCPVIGIALKRYGMDLNGGPFRKDTLIDIPLDIKFPHFIDDSIPEDVPLMGNFKISLQSVVCHRGNSVNSGHYISFIRGTSQIPDGDSESSQKLNNSNNPPHYSADRWIRHDDLAEQNKVSYVDIEEALKHEMPYLLFYQIQPTYEHTPPFGPSPEPPSYTDAAIDSQDFAQRPLNTHQPAGFDGAKDDPIPIFRLSNEAERPPTPRQSINLPEADRSEAEVLDRRGSAFTETSATSADNSNQAASSPATPNEEVTTQRISRSIFSKSGSKSRPPSATGENRISATFSNLSLLSLMRSKEQLGKDSSKEQITKAEAGKENTVPITDGVDESRTSLHIEDGGGTSGEGTTTQSRSKKGKKKNGKAKAEKGEHEAHQGADKGKGKDVPDRECNVM